MMKHKTFNTEIKQLSDEKDVLFAEMEKLGKELEQYRRERDIITPEEMQLTDYQDVIHYAITNIPNWEGK